MLPILERMLGHLYRPVFFAGRVSLTTKAAVAVTFPQRLISEEKNSSHDKEDLMSLMSRVLLERLNNLHKPLECLVQGVGFQRSSSTISAESESGWEAERYLYLALYAYKAVIQMEKKLPPKERTYTGRALQHLGQVYQRLGRMGESKQAYAEQALQTERVKAYQAETQKAFKNAAKFKKLAQQFVLSHKKDAFILPSTDTSARMFNKVKTTGYKSSSQNVDNRRGEALNLKRYIP